MKKLSVIAFLLLGIGFIYAASSSDEGVDLIPEGSEACININTATFNELQGIAHIGIDEAINILRFRRSLNFRFIEDLTYIAGINVNELGEIKTEGLACVPFSSSNFLW